MSEKDLTQKKIEELEEQVASLGKEVERLRNAEVSLRENEEQFRLIFDNSADAIFWADTETGMLINCNRAAEELVERPRSEIIGKHQSILHPPEKYEMFTEVFRKHVGSKGTIDDESEVVMTASGQLKDVHVRAAVTEAGGKKIIQGIFRDITERRKMDREKEVLSQQLLHSQKLESIGALAGGIAHDFNNILATISGMAEVIKRTTDEDSKTYQRIEKMLNSLRRGKDLTMKLLTFARREKLESAIVDVRDIIGEVSDMMKAVAPKNIVINVSGAEECGRVIADTSQLIQALMNICINACDSMNEGGLLSVNVSSVDLNWDFCSFRSHMNPGKFCRIDVIDTGTGIDEEVLPRIFDPFFTTKEKGKGTGLGLSITVGIIQAHGGDITVKSNRGLGTTVSIYLPEVFEKSDIEATDEIGATENLRGVSVLAIDDEVDFLDVLEMVLKLYNAKVSVASNSSVGIEMFRKQPDEFDIVLLDMIMPGRSSSEVFDELRAIKPDCKVVICSGFSLRGQAREILKKGAAGFIQKPFSHGELINIILKICGKIS